ncbi:MAG: phosphopyruvate hydratase [Candidatus Shapirobacteria bacterium]|jgi:enolase
MSKIKSIYAREILASGGEPTLEATVILESGAIGEASVPYGASAGSHEATVLLDGDKSRYNGKGMLKAVANINEILVKELTGMEADDQRKIDEKMLLIDGTEYKSKIGGNAMLGVSMAVARAAAEETKLPLYLYLRKNFGIEQGEIRLPRPMIVMIEGGKHADNSTDLQEYMVSMQLDDSARENVRREMEIYGKLKSIFKELKINTNVGNEGAFAFAGIKQPDVTITGAFAPLAMKSNEEPLGLLLRAIEMAGYKPETEAALSIDAAASEFYENGKYNLKTENRVVTAEELIEYYDSWLNKYPIATMEDMLHEDDWDNWVKLVEKINGKIPLIADDLTVTNTKRWQKAIEMKAATAILIKLNQAGTLTETVDCCLLANKHGLMTVPSHRGGGETNDTFMVDLAVAVGSTYIKVGPTRGERVCKYNRLMRIEEEISGK